MSRGALSRSCSECGGSLAHKSPRAITCSKKCRSARSRREHTNNQKPSDPALRKLDDVVNKEAADQAHLAIRDAMRPVLREALTQEILDAVSDLVKLTPEAVKALQEDLTSGDVGTRQRAYTLIIKYSIGHPALLPVEHAQSSQPINVTFDVPRPPSIEATAEELPPDNPEEGECDVCGERFPLDEFVDGSSRCRTCWATQRAEVAERFEAG